jgi:cytochrome bd-type quinol oxidase subunit 2
MLKRIKSLLISLSFTAAMFVPAVATVGVSAQNIQEGLCAGASLSASGECNEAASEEAASTVDQLLTTVINIFSLVVGVVSVIMIIIGGLKYITSGGDSGNVTGAKNTILYAVIGLVVVALAQIIVRFVLAKVGQATEA